MSGERINTSEQSVKDGRLARCGIEDQVVDVQIVCIE